MTNRDLDKHGDFTASEKEKVNQWLSSHAQGEENVTEIGIPPLRTRSGKFGKRMIIWQVAAALAIFFTGYLTGRIRETTRPDPSSSVALKTSLPIPASRDQKLIVSSQASNTQTVDAGASINPDTPPLIESDRPAKDCAEPQLRRDQNGRFSIETVLCQSGSHATWVINPSLEIANASHHSNQENEK